jgi:hypothetical protein
MFALAGLDAKPGISGKFFAGVETSLPQPLEPQ